MSASPYAFFGVEIPFRKDDRSAETCRLFFQALEREDGPFYVHGKGGYQDVI